ncbi:MAG: FecR domain-containing protein, partial [Treponema sp.]|nr:FecR domain-containing protein [Treponema sp.]
MQKNKNTKSRAVDLLIILLCFAGAGVSGFAFWREYNRTLVKLNEQPVGNIVFKNRTAHRKIENRAAWDRLKQESPIYNGDTIRTAEASEAFITFEDQITKVNLYENTLIQIFYDARGARIDFSGGNVDVASGGGSVFVSSGSSLVEVGSGSRVTLNRGGEGFSLSVTEGQARLDDGTELDSGGMLSFLSDGTLDTAPAVTVTSFGPFARILASPEGTASALFTWNSVNFDADTRVILEIARDRGFSSVSQTREISGASSAAVTLETGEYWWRAYPTRGAGGGIPERGSDSGRIEAFPFAVISPVSPSPSQEFVFSGETSIPFSWTTAEGADAYVLEVSASSNMNNPAVSRLVRETAVTEAGLEPGRWYWRVTPVFPEQVIGTAVPSETDVFSIARGAPSAPALTIPAQDGVLGLDRPRMAWKYDPGVVFWTLEVADNPQMSNPLLQRDSDSNFSSPPAGIFRRDSVYFWRVTARGAGDLSASSPVRSFTTVDHTYRHRAVFPPDNYFTGADELARIRFTYQSNAPYQNYFQISSQSDFSSLEINNPVEAEGGSVSALEPGIWYWRIHADGESGPVSTAPRRLNVASVSEAPRIRVSDSLSQGTALVLDWEPLYFASYQVSVYSAEDREKSIERRITTTSSAAFSTASLEPGDYIVSVEGFNPESAISAWSAGVPAEARLTVVPAPE